jgi:GNAT superfamily N-acetyltransferase
VPQTGKPELIFSVHDEAPAELVAVIDRGLEAHNLAAAPLHEVRPFAVFATVEGRVAGGAIGRTWGACAELTQLWVDPAARRKGLGTSLMRRFEAGVRARGSRTIYLETFSFQAPDFYLRLGYRILNRFDGFAPGVAKYLMARFEPAEGETP